MATLGQEEIFGEAALISDRARNADLIAKSNIDALSISRAAFQQLAKHLPGTRRAIIEIMRKRGIDTSTIEEETG